MYIKFYSFDFFSASSNVNILVLLAAIYVFAACFVGYCLQRHRKQGQQECIFSVWITLAPLKPFEDNPPNYFLINTAAALQNGSE
jgi:hypothetical protein